MPNHVKNILYYTGPLEQVQQMRTFVSDETEAGGLVPFSFQKIIPMPESLNIECSTRSDDALRYYLALKQDKLTLEEQVALADAKQGEWVWPGKYRPMTAEERQDFENGLSEEEREEAIKRGTALMYNLTHYQATTWYDWRRENWGTKWGAYGQKAVYPENLGAGSYIFSTAWAPPTPVIQRLSAMFPDITFVWRWADEDFGYNLGEVGLTNGVEVHRRQIEEGTEEAIAFAQEVWDDGCTEE